MPEHLRALVVILLLASMIFALTMTPTRMLMAEADFIRRRNLWLGLTLVAFLAHNYWLYVLLAGLAFWLTSQREKNAIGLYFFCLFLIPPVGVNIPGFGLINYIFTINHPRLLALVVLLPAMASLMQKSSTKPFGRLTADKILGLYLLLSIALTFRSSDLTGVMRETFYLFIDIALPYYVVSRALKDMSDFKDAMASFLVAVLLLATIGFFEFFRHWLLYNSLIGALGVDWAFTHYLGRSTFLRASATTGQAIALGFVIVVGIGFFLFLRRHMHQPFKRRLISTLLGLGLIAPLSRGPWVGAIALIASFAATGTHAVRNLVLLSFAGTLSLLTLPMLPGGKTAVDLLPFIGSVDKGGIDYRGDLLHNSLIVIERNLWFGSSDYLETPEMEAMRQGENIIDIVNTYVGIALDAGIVGLILFVGFFALIVLNTYHAVRSLPDRNSDAAILGRALLATTIAILVIIATVSSITVIPIVYWSVAAMCVAYFEMVQVQTRTSRGRTKPSQG